jgi:site-specific DNA-adenine methylase
MSKKYVGDCYMNYHGSKSRFLPEVEKLLPKEDGINCLDVFTGGASLASHLPESWSVVANDKESRLVSIHKELQASLRAGHTPESILEDWKMYVLGNINSSKDVEGYSVLKEQYNSSKATQPTNLYALLCSSFSNQLRWNDSGEFNLPFGKRYFNTNMQKKMLAWLHRVAKRDIAFTSEDFMLLDFDSYDLLIVDSPYLQAKAGYNEKGGWSMKQTAMLLSKVDAYARNGGKFILFEELISNGKVNTLLTSWSKKYKHVNLGDNSKYANYQRKNDVTLEVMIYN